MSPIVILYYTCIEYVCIYNYSVLYSVLAIGLNSLKPGLPLGPPRRPRHPPLHPRVWGVQVLQVPQN